MANDWKMSQLLTPAEIRLFLRNREAFLVHFSTIMARDSDRCFPDDLLNAWTLRDVPLAFSTIQRGDSNPQGGGRGGAEGCIGMLVNVGPETEVLGVGPEDFGSNSVTGECDGDPPTLEACEKSIRLRKSSNEWFVRGYIPIGIFLLHPLYARKTFDWGCEQMPIDKDEVFSVFHDKRVFGATDTVFKEYDRSGHCWFDVTYDTIISPN
jgi:hypothetical protein